MNGDFDGLVSMLRKVKVPSVHYYNAESRDAGLLDTCSTGRKGRRYYDPSSADEVPDGLALVLQVNLGDADGIAGGLGFPDHGLLQLFDGDCAGFFFDEPFVRFIPEVPDEKYIPQSDIATSPDPRDVCEYPFLGGAETDTSFTGARLVYEPLLDLIMTYACIYDHDFVSHYIDVPEDEYRRLIDAIEDDGQEHDEYDSDVFNDVALKLGGLPVYTQDAYLGNDEFHLLQLDSGSSSAFTNLNIGDSGVFHIYGSKSSLPDLTDFTTWADCC